MPFSSHRIRVCLGATRQRDANRDDLLKVELPGFFGVELLFSPFSTLREGSGTPLQYSCLENPMDGGAW